MIIQLSTPLAKDGSIEPNEAKRSVNLNSKKGPQHLFTAANNIKLVNAKLTHHGGEEVV